MNILGVDTTTKKANVYVSKNDEIIDRTIDNNITHSEKLLPLIDSTLKEANINLKDINYLACSIGPGSFTGIRIGIATLKSFAKVLNKPIFAVSSLDIIAYEYANIKTDYILSIMDAKNSRIYYCLYKVTYLPYESYYIPVIEPIISYSNDTINDALEMLNIALLNEKDLTNKNIIIVGDCTKDYEEIFLNKFDCLFKGISVYENTISGKSLANLVNNYLKLGYNSKYETDYLTLDALYVRPSQAERAKNNEL